MYAGTDGVEAGSKGLRCTQWTLSGEKATLFRSCEKGGSWYSLRFSTPLFKWSVRCLRPLEAFCTINFTFMLPFSRKESTVHKSLYEKSEEGVGEGKGKESKRARLSSTSTAAV